MRAGDITVLQTQTRARSLSKPNPAAAPAAPARSPLVSALSGRARALVAVAPPEAGRPRAWGGVGCFLAGR